VILTLLLLNHQVSVVCISWTQNVVPSVIEIVFIWLQIWRSDSKMCCSLWNQALYLRAVWHILKIRGHNKLQTWFLTIQNEIFQQMWKKRSKERKKNPYYPTIWTAGIPCLVSATLSLTPGGLYTLILSIYLIILSRISAKL